MQFVSRKFALVVLAVLALGASGCGSNNKGKIEGKWRIVSTPGEKSVELGEGPIYMYYEFLPDGTTNLGIAATDAKEAPVVLTSGKYKLLTGDDVEFSGMSEEGAKKGGLFGKGNKGRLRVKIDGDNMTITGSDGTMKLTRVK